MDRRQFIKTGGSIAVGLAVFGTVGGYLWKMVTNPGKLFFDTSRRKVGERDTENKDFASPYKLTAGFLAPDTISAFEMCGDNVVLATQNNIYVYTLSGQLVSNFATPSDVRDIAVYDNKVYLLYAARVEVYTLDGEDVINENTGEALGWDACSDDADYCAFTVFDNGVFVTDASNKIIVKYNLDGTLARFIKSPEGFVVPSYSMAITNMNGMVYCSNPGRHKVEVYDSNGDFISSFGKAGTDAGAFSGCCNPAQLAINNVGEILTSEKGVPRVSCYTTDGTFKSVLLNAKMLGGGHDAYDVRVAGDKLVVAGGKKVQVFQYNSQLAEMTLCGSCTADCPMKAKG